MENTIGMSPQEAKQLLQERLSPMGTTDYIRLIQTLVQELGIFLSFAIDPAFTAQVRATQDIAGVDLYEREALPVLFTHTGIAQDLEELEKELHQSVAKLFGKHKARTNSHYVPTVSKERN